jgi:hypothetical protein
MGEGADEGAHTKHRACNIHRGQCDDQEWAMRGRDLKHSGATCAMRASLGIFVHPTKASSMIARLIPASGWRTTASCAGRVMTSLSSSASPSAWSTRPELGSITCPETRLIVGRISRRSSRATFRTHTCGLTIPVGLHPAHLPKMS